MDLSKDPLHHDRATRRLQPRGNRGATGHLARPIPAAEERLGADVPGMGRAHRPAHRRTQEAEDRYRQLHLRAHEGVCGRSLRKIQPRRSLRPPNPGIQSQRAPVTFGIGIFAPHSRMKSMNARILSGRCLRLTYTRYKVYKVGPWIGYSRSGTNSSLKIGSKKNSSGSVPRPMPAAIALAAPANAR